MNKQRKVLITITYNEMGVIIDTKTVELGSSAQPEPCEDTISGQAARGLSLAQSENDWIPVTKKAHPDLPIRVQVQMDNGWIITAYYQEGEWLSVPDCGEPIQDKWIEAWRELPEPYAEEGREE